jgi:hypothetical protein
MKMEEKYTDCMLRICLQHPRMLDRSYLIIDRILSRLNGLLNLTIQVRSLIPRLQA